MTDDNQATRPMHKKDAASEGSTLSSAETVIAPSSSQISNSATGKKQPTDFSLFNPTENGSTLTRDDLLPGTIIKNRFVLEKRIGRGGMGTIFLARDLRKEELHDRDPFTVIKFLNEDLHDDMGAIMALQREAKKSQTLSHPNIVTVYDFDRENSIFFLSMEYLRGESLDSYIARSANRAEKKSQLFAYIEFMARGLAYAHQEGFVHADFKPANVFLSENQQIKILDFGIAQAVRSNLATGATEHAALHNETVFDPASLGALTPNYASLEMLQNQRPLPSDDVYALACVAYELLAGHHPFLIKGKRVSAVEAQKHNLEPKAIEGISRRHMNALRKGLAFKREDRFANAGQFIDAIKPRTRLRNSLVAVIALLIVGLISSWAITVGQSEAAISFDDLPPSMANIVQTIQQGDSLLHNQEYDQAHKLYVQAWESGKDVSKVDSSDHYKLKVLINRRIDRIVRALIKQAERPDLDAYSLLQLQLALEFLHKDELGTLRNEIGSTLASLDRRVEQTLNHDNTQQPSN